MKKQWLLYALLVAFDQGVKLLIWNFAMPSYIVLIPGVLRFEPYQNTSLSWVASMAGVVAPVVFMVVLQVVMGALVVLFYRFEVYKGGKHPFLNLGFCLLLAGITCSFIDVVFWGGSLDYVGLFNWFIFDAKDVYLNAGWISILVWLLVQEVQRKKQGLEEKKVPLGPWLKSGCPLKPKDEEN